MPEKTFTMMRRWEGKSKLECYAADNEIEMHTRVIARGMKTSRLLSEFFDLLRFYEGVEVGDCHESGGRQVVSLRIADPKSIVRLDYFCTAANVRFNIYAESLPTDADSTENALKRLVFGIVFSEEENNSDNFGELNIFCACMVRDLVQRGVLNEAESARFLSALEGVSNPKRWENGALPPGCP